MGRDYVTCDVCQSSTKGDYECDCQVEKMKNIYRSLIGWSLESFELVYYYYSIYRFEIFIKNDSETNEKKSRYFCTEMHSPVGNSCLIKELPSLEDYTLRRESMSE